MKCHIFFLLCKAYERKEYVLVYCKALHFHSKKRYTFIFFSFFRERSITFSSFLFFFFFLFLRVKMHYTLEVDKDNNWASIGMSDIHGQYRYARVTQMVKIQCYKIRRIQMHNQEHTLTPHNSIQAREKAQVLYAGFKLSEYFENGPFLL